MRSLVFVITVALVSVVACNRETSLDPVKPPNGWTTITPDHQQLLHDLRLDYRERKTMTIVTYASPTGQQQLRVIKLRAEFPPSPLLARLAGHRLQARRIATLGDLMIDELSTDDAYHVGFQVRLPTKDNTDEITRSPTMLASCLGTPADPIRAGDPCRRAIASAVEATQDDADGSWMLWYIGGLIFAALVIGRRLQLGRRLLPPKGPSGLPTARVR